MNSSIPTVPPQLDLPAFNCPHCQAYSHMRWFTPQDLAGSGPIRIMPNTKIAKCTLCMKFSHWVDGVIVFPISAADVDDPNADLPQAVKDDYLEAASIIAESPRGGAAIAANEER